MDYNNVILVLQSMYKKSTHMVGGSLKGGFINPQQNENKAINLAIEALEKQIPRKPAVEEEMGYFICPSCDMDVGYANAKEEHNYCFNCGQRIKWN